MRESARSGLGLRALIVEDDAALARSLARLLRARGFESWATHTVREGSHLLDQATWDLVLADLSLPDGSGEVLVRQASASNARVLVVSGTANAKLAIAVQTLGAVLVLKPFGPVEFDAALEFLFRRSVPPCHAGAWTSPRKGRRRKFTICEERGIAGTSRRAIRLRPAELALLRALARTPEGEWVTTARLLERLELGAQEGSERRVYALVHALRARLQAIGAHDWLESRRGFGYRRNSGYDTVITQAARVPPT